MPGEGKVLRQDELAIVANAAAGWQIRRGLGTKIRTATGGQPEGPHFIRAKAQAPAESRIFETGLGDAPGFGARGESRILHFRGVIESAAGAGDSDAAGVARPPDDGKAQIFVRVIAGIVLADVAPFQEIVRL